VFCVCPSHNAAQLTDEIKQEVEYSKQLWSAFAGLCHNFLMPVTLRRYTGMIAFFLCLFSFSRSVLFSHLEPLSKLCIVLIQQFKDSFAALYDAMEFAITPYIHLLCHLHEIQERLGVVIGHFQNSSMSKCLEGTVGRSDSYLFSQFIFRTRGPPQNIAKTEKFASNNDAGHENATFLLPNDRSGLVTKQRSEPHSLLEFLEYLYAPLLLRVSLPEELYPPTHAITFPKFYHAKYTTEIRNRKRKCDGMLGY
jgi:hypothetical protein